MDLAEARLFPVGGDGPEDVLVDPGGRVLTGLDDGRVVRLDPETGRVETIARLPGRPLGLEFLTDAEIVVCASAAGLLAVTLDGGAVRTHVDTVDGRRLGAVNNAAVGADGSIYFSDSSQRFPIPQWRTDLVQRTRSGRLFRRAADGEVTELLGGLEFANGVALAPDESWVAVAETAACRMQRVWLTGDRAGASEVLVDDLGGYPDNIALGDDGLVWVALPGARRGVVDRVQRAPRALRTAVSRIPQSLQPREGRRVGLAAVDPTGRVVHQTWGAIDGFSMLTGVRKAGDALWLGSLRGGAVAQLPVRP
jgi:sugar lactone lactonase YvrE